MSLRSKIVLILVAVVLTWAAADNGVLRLFAHRIFGAWERQEASQDLARIRRRIDAELRDLEGKARVLARSSDLRTFVRSGDPDFVATDLGAGALENAGVDLLYLCAAGGQVAWGLVLDQETREPVRVAEFPRGALAPNHVALNYQEGATGLTGIMSTHREPLLFSSIPIPGEDGSILVDSQARYSGPAVGAVILGRFLGANLRRRIVQEELEGIPEKGDLERIELLDLDAPQVPEALARSSDHELFEEGADGRLHAYGKIDFQRTGVPLVLHVAMDRAISARGAASVNYALLSTLSSALLILFVLLRLLQGNVIEPLSRLTHKAVEIGRRDDTTIRVNMQRPDEIGQLAGEFDSMLEKLARSREQVVETARLAGRSEIATGVLHNVGNVLNSVNVAASLALRRVEELSVRDLELLVEVLEKNREQLAEFVASERGQHLVPYLGEISRSLDSQKQAMREELATLNQGIEHIAELVRAQQSFAGTRGVFELASLEEQIETALRICAQHLGEADRIQLVREFEPLPSVRVDRHKLMEIVVNLVQNACQSLAQSDGDERRLTLRLWQPEPGLARIEVRDNGVGIAPENLTRVFEHGFTTRPGGHGFGLHVSANAATEMGAKLRASSEGPGRGATFCLDIPMEEVAALAA